MTTTIALAQCPPAWEDPAASLARADRAAGLAVQAGASLVCFPEQYATGWDPFGTTFVQDENGDIANGFAAIARRHRIAVLGSFREHNTPRPLNTAIAVDPGGNIIGKYAKIHLFSPACEQEAFLPGENLSLFSLGGVRFGIAICYDLRFPELFTAYARAGADCVLVQAAWPCERLGHWELFIRARALETQGYIAGINTTGTTPVGDYCGGSLVAGPGGETVAAAGKDPVVITARIDPEAVAAKRLSFPSLSDRREDIYQQLRQP
jgi:omega-amidase